MSRDENFERAVKVVLSHEGGYRNRPSDPGGPTKFGISQRSYPDLDIRHLTEEEATVIYRKDWWEKHQYNRIGNYPLALKVFDHSVNIGPKRAHTFLQQAVNEIIQEGGGEACMLLKVDGILGALTFDAVNALDDSILLLRFLARVHKHYKACAKKQPDELEGWEARLWACL